MAKSKAKVRTQPVRKPKIRKGDTVVVISGKDRGKQGEVLRVFPGKARALVQGVNEVSKHSKPSEKDPRGGIVKKEIPIALSNLMVVGGDGTASRVGVRREANEAGKTKRVRFLKKTDQNL
ncbi:MAG: 50S ribosomal protein L24 [Myxococcales bacterium]|nr:50S ribosomal protein L24 [Myxococcales bacterium]|tara:strand:- start:1967 stop:2329 length:363 start_codon:yes stop_codon:yes gene_type:complete